mgnify:CR=1 FL=1
MIIKGVGIGRGVAVGPVIRMAQPLPEPSDAPRAEGIAAESEIARVEKSLALVNADLNRRAEEAANGDEGAKQAAPILQAVAMFASDPSLAESIKGLIQQGKTAERAVLEGFAAVEDMFRAIGGYQAERAADLHDVGQRVIADLMGAPAPGLPQSETPFVLVAEDLSPADTAALDMQAAKKAIEEAKANIEKLTKDADAQEVTAKVGGTIASVTVTAGDTASADTAIATINQTDRGFTVKISITNEQAKKVKVGDTAELVNYWGDATATLETIGNDPQNPQKNRQLTFRLTGSDIQPDSNITLAIGQKSASYDAIVPTSAIRTDNNGSFVLAIVSKSTPLSTRYTATRVDVQVLASDDKSSAVSGIGSGEFVITTSTKPIEAGTQVRLAENG